MMAFELTPTFCNFAHVVCRMRTLMNLELHPTASSLLVPLRIDIGIRYRSFLESEVLNFGIRIKLELATDPRMQRKVRRSRVNWFW